MSNGTITQSDWVKGIGFSILSSIIGGASKLAIRKSWQVEELCQNLTTGDFMLLVDVSQHTSVALQVENGSTPLERDKSYQGDRSDEASVTNERQSLHTSAALRMNEPSTRITFRGLLCAPPVADAPLAQTREQMALKRLYQAYFLRGMGTLGMTTLNPLTTVIAMNYASPSILAPFSGLTLVWIILFSPLVLEETPSLRQVIACAFILLGEVVVAAFGDHKNDDGVSIHDVVQSYHKAKFLMFCFGLVAWMMVLMFVIRNEGSSPKLKRFAWGVAGGSVTGFQNFLKDALTVLKASSATSTKVPVLGIPMPPMLFFVLMAGAISAAVGGLLILIQCMKRYDATYSSAMFVGSFVVSASIMSAVHYGTFANLHGLLQYVLYPVGLILLLIGIVLLAVAAAPDRYEDGASVGGGDFNDSQHSTQSVDNNSRDELRIN